VTREHPSWHDRRVLWAITISMTCLFLSRLLDDPHDSFGGPVLHFIALIGAGILSATSIVLLVRRRKGGSGNG